MEKEKREYFLYSLKPVAFILGIGMVVFGAFRFFTQNDPIALGEDALLGVGLGIIIYAISTFGKKKEKDEDDD